ILHGDFHFGNVMADESGTVRAVVDWEMATVGDPLLDLGWLLATWPEPGRPDVLGTDLHRLGGLPSIPEAVERYSEATSRDLSALDWYVVLACFKLGIILEGTYARACAGLAPTSVGDRLH